MNLQAEMINLLPVVAICTVGWIIYYYVRGYRLSLTYIVLKGLVSALLWRAVVYVLSVM